MVKLNRPPSSPAVEYLHAHCLERVSVSDVAAALDVHPARLARVFRRHPRVPIGDYVRDLRLQRAIDLLTGSTQRGRGRSCVAPRSLALETFWIRTSEIIKEPVRSRLSGTFKTLLPAAA